MEIEESLMIKTTMGLNVEVGVTGDRVKTEGKRGRTITKANNISWLGVKPLIDLPAGLTLFQSALFKITKGHDLMP